MKTSAVTKMYRALEKELFVTKFGWSKGLPPFDIENNFMSGAIAWTSFGYVWAPSDIATGITLNEAFTSVMDEDEVDCAIRHEIAHAMLLREETNHTPVWEKMAVECGAIPDPIFIIRRMRDLPMLIQMNVSPEAFALPPTLGER